MRRSIPAFSAAGKPLAALRAMALLCALSVASCSTVQPQIFSQELSPAVMTGPDDNATESPKALPAAAPASAALPEQPDVPVGDAIRQAEALQRLYVKAVKEQSGVNAGTSAALIALSAAAMITGVTHPNGKDLAVMGVAGSGLYAYASTMTSKPRQLVYLAGVETLSCAIAATRPYALPDGFLSASKSSPRRDRSLDKLSAEAERQARVLSALIERLTALNSPRYESQPERKSTCTSPAAPLPEKPSSNNPDRLRVYNDRVADRARADAACAGRAGSVQEFKPSPQIGLMIGQLQAQRKHLHKLVTQAQKQAVVFGNAGNALRKVTEDTQLSVGREVLKTEPDVAAVLSAAQAMRGTAFAISAAPAFKPEAPASAAGAAGAAEASGTPGKKSPTVLTPKISDPPEELLNQARSEIQRALEIGDQLKGKLEILSQRLLLTRTPLERCGQGSTGAVLSLSPDLPEVDLVPGASQNFSVSGGTGTPQAKATPGLTRNLDGTFTYKLPATTEVGSKVTLSFSDGSGKLTREVTINAVAASEEAAPSATLDAGNVLTASMSTALGLTTQPPSAQQVSDTLTACLKGPKFNIAAPDLEHVPVDVMAKVLRGDCRATP